MAADQPTRTPPRLLAVAAGLGVAVLAGAAFVLTYEDLRTLALAGGAARRWAPAYPLMIDTLITVTVLALIAARHAHWWSRLLRWTLLALLLGGAAAASVQRAVKGYGSLPDQPLKAGVAVAPHLLILIAVWLWLAMFRHVRRPAPKPSALAPEPTPEPTPTPEPAPAPAPAPEAPPTKAPEDHNGEIIPGLTGLPVPGPPEDDPRVPEVPAELTKTPDPPAPAPAPADDDPTPPAGFPVHLPTDVELVRSPPKPAEPSATTQPDLASTTRPDFALPGTPYIKDPSYPFDQEEEESSAAEDDDEDPEVDRAEDPDAGDGDEDEPSGGGRHRLRRPPVPAPVPGVDEDEVARWTDEAAEAASRWVDETADETAVEWTPPSSKFRSSPTPPQD